MGKKKKRKKSNKGKDFREVYYDEDGFRKGRFSPEEDEVIRQNWMSMTDAEIAKLLKRKKESVSCRRSNALGLVGKNAMSNPEKQALARKDLSMLSEEGKKKYYLAEFKGSASYRQYKTIFDKEEMKYYEEQYLAFRMDPSVETMTGPELETLHEMVVAKVQIIRLLKEEKKQRDNGNPGYSNAPQIEKWQGVVERMRKSLNVERSQRLKNNSDQAITFTNIVKELSDPHLRREIGYEAAMLKYIGEQYYNKNLGRTIISGQEDEYDLAPLFGDKEVRDLGADFLEKIGDAETEDNS